MKLYILPGPMAFLFAERSMDGVAMNMDMGGWIDSFVGLSWLRLRGLEWSSSVCSFVRFEGGVGCSF